jgi:hypothetical protein
LRVVDLVERLLSVEFLPDPLVDVPTRTRDVERRVAHGGKAGHPSRIVALVGTAYESFAETERADELGSTGQERHDAPRFFGEIR